MSTNPLVAFVFFLIANICAAVLGILLARRLRDDFVSSMYSTNVSPSDAESVLFTPDLSQNCEVAFWAAGSLCHGALRFWAFALHAW